MTRRLFAILGILFLGVLLLLVGVAQERTLHAQSSQQSTAPPTQAAPAPQTPPAPTHADILHGEYGPYRANNDLLYYHLDVRVGPEKKSISGKNTIRFKMLKDDKRIQIDLQEPLAVDKILLGATLLK